MKNRSLLFFSGLVVVALVGSFLFFQATRPKDRNEPPKQPQSYPRQVTEESPPAKQKTQESRDTAVSVLDVAGQNRSFAQRRQEQINNARSRSVLHQFQFSDRFESTGITFNHQVVEDAGKRYKPVHYDHGNGLAIADVDLDGFYDIYFTTQIGSNELWRNLGDGTFENITDSSKVGLEDRISVAASFGDIDNDGDSDLYVTTVKMGNVLFENLGDGKFRDKTQESGLDYVGHSSGTVFFG